MPEQSAHRREETDDDQKTVNLKGETYENHRYSCSGRL